MTAAWSAQQLEQIGGAEELEIATKRADGTLRRWVPIWVVCVDADVYVRTWYRRDDGWYGHALDTRQARIRVPASRSTWPSRTSQTGPSCVRASMPPTTPSTDATAARPWIA